MVGSAIVRTLLAQGVEPRQIVFRTHAELDLTNQAAVNAFFDTEQPLQPKSEAFMPTTPTLQTLFLKT